MLPTALPRRLLAGCRASLALLLLQLLLIIQVKG